MCVNVLNPAWLVTLSVAGLATVIVPASTAAKILPKGFAIDYGGESRQLRTEGSKFLPTMLLSLVFYAFAVLNVYTSAQVFGRAPDLAGLAA